MKNVILIMLIGLLGTIYIFIRNGKVYRFRRHIVYLIHSRVSALIDEGASYEDIFEPWGILNNISYEKMLFSFKPLKMEYWFTEKELKLLKYKSYDNRNKI